MPTNFSPAAFEHLLFPLHRSVYTSIERKLCYAEASRPGSLAGAAAFARRTNGLGTLEPVPKDLLEDIRLPDFDIRLVVAGDGKLRKETRHKAEFTPHSQRPSLGYPGAHLVVVVATHTHQHAFIMPLGFALRALEDVTLRPGGFQVYQHHLYPSTDPLLFAPQIDGQKTELPYKTLASSGLLYTGLTGRSWARRYQEHKYAAGRGSQTLFHIALRGEFFHVVKTEHEILRAGLDRDTAVHVEEVVIEERSLYPVHQRGLNMIPGGDAGLRFLARLGRSGTRRPDPEAGDEAYIDGLNEMLGARRTGCAPDASAIARLWAEDLDFRIGATCGRADRLSQLQITFARIWSACGWDEDKIAGKLNGIDHRRANTGQVRRLLSGQSYNEIPNVLPKAGKPRGRDPDEDDPSGS
ncbi:hypothetical protein RGUI_0097 (plasmid) [Rhodovulum sp. P5]|uniref:hypothetical protein n=1 Tax=Rhodovulum sp. P5 TaxID=1564506 RepID=UPI0009C2AC40|nr:hypothetical protein [Rhodovulum sp. P5]ARE42455.1 hypothetical protein RGUI_0097 [Rhodovulum sp. P5]